MEIRVLFITYTQVHLRGNSCRYKTVRQWFILQKQVQQIETSSDPEPDSAAVSWSGLQTLLNSGPSQVLCVGSLLILMFFLFTVLFVCFKHPNTKVLFLLFFLWLFDSLLLNKTGFGLVLVFSGHSLGSGESLSKVTQKHLYTKSTCWDTLTVEDSKPGETWTMTSRIMYWH